MKKAFLSIFCLIFLNFSIFAETVITTYRNPTITDFDVLETFISEMNKLPYYDYLFEYEVFDNPDKQNYAWAVIKDKGYDSVTLILQTDNGIFTVNNEKRDYSYSYSSYSSKYTNDKYLSYSDAAKDFNSKMFCFVEECYSLQKRWGRKERGVSLARLLFINYDKTKGDYFFSSYLSHKGRKYIKTSSKEKMKGYGEDIQDSFVLLVYEMSDYSFSLMEINSDIKYKESYIPENYDKVLDNIKNITFYNAYDNKQSYFNIYVVRNRDYSGEDEWLYERVSYKRSPTTRFSEDDEEKFSNVLSPDVFYRGIVFEHNKEAKKKVKDELLQANLSNYYLRYPYKHYINFGAGFVPHPNTGFQLDVDYNYALTRFSFGPGFSFNRTEKKIKKVSEYGYVSNEDITYDKFLVGLPLRLYLFPMEEIGGFFLNLAVIPSWEITHKYRYNDIDEMEYGFCSDFRIEGGLNFLLGYIKAFVGYNLSSTKKNYVTVGLATGITLEG